jgi:beta-glucosidase
MGQEAGNAFADILFGDVCPSGKLTITYPKDAGQIPIYYNYKPSARYFEYVSGKREPLYPFGFGLSYSAFEYSDISLSATTMKKEGFVTARVRITNAGKVNGDEIVQLYIRDKVSSVTRPVNELKDFARISLQPGETKEVSFKIDASKLSFWTKEMKYDVESGEFEIMIGKSSVDGRKVNLLVY